MLIGGYVLLEPDQPTMATPSLGTDCLNCHATLPASRANVKSVQAPEEAKADVPQSTAPEGQPDPAKLVSQPVADLAGKSVVVTASVLNVRESGSAQTRIIGTVKKNDVLSVLQVKYGWCQVKFGQGTGWVYGNFVKAAAGNEAAKQQSPAAPAAAKPVPVAVPSIVEQSKNSPLGSRHWNMFRNTYNNPADPEQSGCLGCHSAVKIVDDPQATITDFLKAEQEYCYEEAENPAPGQSPFLFRKAEQDGKYADNDLEGITCRVCHDLNKEGIPLRRPDNTCSLCHGRTFNWSKGSGKHVAQDFFAGHGENYYDPSVHYTLGLQCQDCHVMNAVKHDYEAAQPEDIVQDSQCLPCHKSAAELHEMIEATREQVAASVKEIDAQVEKGLASVPASDAKANELLGKARARSSFIKGDLSNGVHNPQFAAKLINEAMGFLGEYDKLQDRTSQAATVNLGGLSVYSQAQTSHLGSVHWDMLENTIFNPADPGQDHCITCHSAVAIVDDPKAKVTDFLKTGQKYCVEELESPAPGQDPFVYATAAADGKYLLNYYEGITCRVCHTFASPTGDIALRRSGEQTCGLCHGRTFNWDKGSGSHVELAFFKGQGSTTQAIAEQPGPKAAMGFNCQDCHFMDGTKHDYAPATPEQVAASSKCNVCHKTAAEYESLVEGIQGEVEAGLKKLEAPLQEAKAYADAHPENAEAKALYTQAKAGVTFVQKDFSSGVHNPPFARALLARSTNLLDQFRTQYK